MSETASHDRDPAVAGSTDQALTDQILAVVAKETGIERSRLVPDATIEQLGIASIDVVQTIFELESRFDVEIPVLPTDKGAEFTTVGDLVGHVLVTLHQQAAQKAGMAANPVPNHGGAT